MVAAGKASSAPVHVVSVDPSPISQHVAKKIWEFAGVSSQITLLQGTLHELLERGATELHQQFPIVFLDHQKDAYYSDLKLLEKQGVVDIGTAVVCDNMVGFRTEDLSHYLGMDDGAAHNPDYKVSMYNSKLGPTVDRADAVVVAIRVTSTRQSA